MGVDEHPLAEERDAWETVVEECRALADDYRRRGWEVFTAVPGDVTPVPAPGDSRTDKTGLDVLLSGAEFAELSDLVDAVGFDEFESFRAHENGIVYLTLLFLAPDAETAVCLPLYYRVAEADRMLERVRAGDAMKTYVHPLSGERRVEFDHEDPTPLFPPQDVSEE